MRLGPSVVSVITRSNARPHLAALRDGAITLLILGLYSVPSRLSALLRPCSGGLTALTGTSIEPVMGTYVMAQAAAEEISTSYSLAMD
jgi:hypothetical protein